MFFLPGGFRIYLHITQPIRTSLVRESDISNMVRRGTVCIAARLLGRTWHTESGFCVLCFCHQVAPLWLCRAVWGLSRMGEHPLSGLLAYSVWMSLVDSRWGGVTPPDFGPTRLADPNRSPGRETIYILYCTGTLIDMFFLRVVLVPVVYKQFL